MSRTIYNIEFNGKLCSHISLDVMNYNAVHGCMKCETEGRYSYVSNTTIFPDLNAPPRTNESFRVEYNPNHHRGKTPLLDLPIDMVLDIPVGDELHLLHLGLMKKFLNSWRTGLFGLRTKWSKNNEREIDTYLTSCSKPFEIHRRIRGQVEKHRV